MNHKQAQEILNKIIERIFEHKNPWTLQQYMEKNAFDVRLPMRANDFMTGEDAWVSSMNPPRFRTFNNLLAQEGDFMIPTRKIENIEDLLSAWEETNWFASDRNLDSINLLESDNIRSSENIFRSQDVNESNNILFSDGCHASEFSASVQRSGIISFSCRVEDSSTVSNSFSVSWSKNVNNSMFIQDSSDLYECLFCSHINSKEYCVANMQFEKEEYFRIKNLVQEWVLNN